MIYRLSLKLAPIVLLLALLQSCSNSSSTQPSGSNVTDTSKHSTGNFSAMSVSVQWSWTAYATTLSVHIDSAGHPLANLIGDSLFYLGTHSITGLTRVNDTLWQGELNEIVDSGTYVFTFRRVEGADTLNASFSLPVIPFHITAPAQHADVVPGISNDTVRYTPAGGQDVCIFYQDDDDYSNRALVENLVPDNGTYPIEQNVFRDGYIYLIRHFVGNLASPAPFQAVHYDYHESSQHVELQF